MTVNVGMQPQQSPYNASQPQPVVQTADAQMQPQRPPKSIKAVQNRRLAEQEFQDSIEQARLRRQHETPAQF